jgi:lipoprotein-anchoring transpeptidase ErfK/SrfK
MNRRTLALGLLSAPLLACSPAQAAKRQYVYEGARVVWFDTPEEPGTIIIDTSARALHYVLGGGQAIRYGVAVGKQGFDWAGIAKIGRKVEWPKWTPPKDMIERRPELAKFAEGVPPGPENPLGARAMYLFDGGHDTLYRIHGTNEPQSIGRAASSGCIRMLNEEVIDLYDRSPLGTKVIVL